jgi:hypothetical protein
MGRIPPGRTRQERVDERTFSLHECGDDELDSDRDHRQPYVHDGVAATVDPAASPTVTGTVHGDVDEMDSPM